MAPVPSGFVLIAISPLEDSLDVQMLHETLVPFGGAVVAEPEVDLQPHEVLARIPAGSNPAVLPEYSIRSIDVPCRNINDTSTCSSREEPGTSALVEVDAQGNTLVVESPDSVTPTHYNDINAIFPEKDQVESRISSIEMKHSSPKPVDVDAKMSHVEPVNHEPVAEVATSPTATIVPSQVETANVVPKWIPAVSGCFQISDLCSWSLSCNASTV
ncbi:DNA mismatch repair protein, putative [Babesia ovata]|uniref:DNA mismatch repair protein, putative n=1 Tax=Babesia ovata TaxID=189622 RepID=A0A2H6KEU1_9APIC|nr:DNA mismatch repair protein, putative [Babesia ovata]GBE61505.1 DNA mismatch repair protein, putative [Babesia ovata]